MSSQEESAGNHYQGILESLIIGAVWKALRKASFGTHHSKKPFGQHKIFDWTAAGLENCAECDTRISSHGLTTGIVWTTLSINTHSIPDNHNWNPL
eukprot:8672448-Pyramimonas_sp.AAC.1